ncbi:MAG: hypothetical protein E6I91_07975 [Chloroflexi bacterium]|nr:MAG: hypothetical protein E6I91_07975 [Chloroflexota bacterium]
MPIPYEQQFIEGILACLTNGVITIDSSDLITTWNPAAGNILRLEPSITLGKRYQDVFGSLPQLGLIGVLNTVRMQRSPGIVRTLVKGNVPERGQVSLDLCIDVLVDSRLTYLGMVLVINDQTGR